MARAFDWQSKSRGFEFHTLHRNRSSKVKGYFANLDFVQTNPTLTFSSLYY